jgi:tRNA threonylcarbamoyladenosine biosynthesis protein TsaB
MGGAAVIVLGIETSTSHTSVAIGTGTDILAAVQLTARARQDAVVPSIEHLLEWTGLGLSAIGGIAVGLGPGLFTGLRVGVEAGKSLAQVLKVPIVGIGSLDALAFAARHTNRTIAAVIDARRSEVFYATYRSVPGGIVRRAEPQVAPPDHLAADLQALGGEVLLVGNGAILYRQQLEEASPRCEFASAAWAHPQAQALVELAVPRLLREEHDRLFDVVPFYLRKSDAEIAWDQRRRGTSA